MKQRQLWFKKNIFFLKIYAKAHCFSALFFIKIKNKCWERGCFKMNIIHNPVKITKYSIQGGPQNCPYFSLAITFIKIRKPSTFNLSQPAWQSSEGVPERQILWKQSTDKRGHHQKRNQMDSTRIGQKSCGQF